MQVQEFPKLLSGLIVARKTHKLVESYSTHGYSLLQKKYTGEKSDKRKHAYSGDW